MGDRVSISFRNGKQESVVLFHHWGGKQFPQKALQYAKDLVAELESTKICVSEPLTRLEPETVMVDFIRYITKDKSRIMSSLYLGRDQNDGDNSDNGHFVIDLQNFEIWNV